MVSLNVGICGVEPINLLALLLTLQPLLRPGPQLGHRAKLADPLGKFNSRWPRGWTLHCLGAADPSSPPALLWAGKSAKFPRRPSSPARHAGGRRSERAEPLTSSSGLRTPNCTLLMVRSGHALSPEGGPPPCIAEAGALRRRKPHYKKPAPPAPRRSDPVGAAAGKDLPELGGKSRRRKRWGRKGGGETKRGERSSPPPFRKFFVSQKENKKRKGKEKVLGEEEEKG